MAGDNITTPSVAAPMRPTTSDFNVLADRILFSVDPRNHTTSLHGPVGTALAHEAPLRQPVVLEFERRSARGRGVEAR